MVGVGKCTSGLNAHLFVDGGPFTKHDISSNESRNERIETTLLAPASFLLYEKQRLVERDELGEVERVLPRRPVDRFEPCLPATRRIVSIPSGPVYVNSTGVVLTLPVQRESP